MAVSRSDATSLRAGADARYRKPSDKLRGKVHLATGRAIRRLGFGRVYATTQGDMCGRSQPFLRARLSFISIEHGSPGAIA